MSPSANSLPNGQSPPLRITLVRHQDAVHDFVAEMAAAQGWRFRAYPDFSGAVGAFGAPLSGNGDPPLASASAGAAAPHVLLAALCPPSGPCALEWTRQLAALDGSLRFVLLAEPADAALGLSAIYTGASAVLLLPPNRVELLTAIQRAAAGRRFLPAAVQEASLDALDCPAPARSCSGLTRKDIKVLWAMSRGRGEKEAAQLLGIKPNTVHAHVKHIYLKLGVHSLSEAVEKAFGRLGCPYTCLRRERERSRVKKKQR